MKHQLQALALPAEVQLNLLPDFVCKGDELAIDYSHWCLVLLSNDSGQLTELQIALLTQLDNYFDKMSQLHDESLWTDEAIKIMPEWAKIREMATGLLNSFQWPIEVPDEPI